MINKVASFLLKGPNPILKFFNSFEICSPKVVVLVAINPYEGVVHSTSIREVLVRSSKRLSEPGTLIKENLMAILCYDVFLGLRFHAWRLSQRKCFRPSMNKRRILEIFFFASNLSQRISSHVGSLHSRVSLSFCVTWIFLVSQRLRI